jgi:hypothetical protein
VRPDPLTPSRLRVALLSYLRHSVQNVYALHSESATLNIIEAQSPVANLLPEHTVFFNQIINDVALTS